MASVQYLFSYTNTISAELQERQILFTLLNKFRTICALLIQRTWRGYHQKQKYQSIKKAIVTIQSFYRGWEVRRKRALYEAQHKLDMGMLRLHKAATTIQAAWKGYMLRKLMKGRTPKELIAVRKKMVQANEEMRVHIKEQFEANMSTQMEKDHDEDLRIILFILFKCHHLMRTKQKEGIYSCHRSKHLSSIEEMMKLLPLKEYMDDVRKCYNQAKKDSDTQTMYMFENKSLRKFEDLLRLRDKRNDLKTEPQKDLIIHDKPFHLSKKICRKYQPNIQTSEKYTPAIECVTHNDEIKSMNISSDPYLVNLKMNLKDKILPYYIDFWETHMCSEHNPADLSE